MQTVLLGLIYVLFFLSGAAALIYQVVWVRSLSLVFGGSHLAVTTVLAVFMGGLALGSYLFGKRLGQGTKLLRLYGILELGIAFSALAFKALMHLYPDVYIFLSQFAPSSTPYLMFIRVSIAVTALLLPTTLMGGTLPVLSGFISGEGRKIGRHLSFLYGFNTLGAVAGTIAAAFFLLRHFGVNATLTTAIVLNLLVGTISILLQGKFLTEDSRQEPEPTADRVEPADELDSGSLTPYRLVLWGIGVSGFCALGYEILWTRILSIVIGASVYGFSIMLVAFLSGIAAGSAAYGLLLKLLKDRHSGHGYPLSRSVLWFGAVQVIIGISALLVTINIRDLPNSTMMQQFLPGSETGVFGGRIWSSLLLAFAYMFGPAFFMGVAFPLAGRVHVGFRKAVGHAVGEVLAYNTIGAILGSVVSGFILIYLVGIERSLQILILINIAFGLTVISSMQKKKLLTVGIPAVCAASILFLSLNPGIWHFWDTRDFAMQLANQPKSSQDPSKTREDKDRTVVLYYGEGAQAIVSSVKTKGGNQFFITNGRPEASDSLADMQCQYTLGHVPMLLNKNPRKVFVLGTGSGMTLGSTSVHPSVEQIVLAEIEPKVLGVARSFANYNHDVLNNPKLKIVFNDGRNYLLTTREKFDVITADPIHPWFSGAGYLYSDEYFRLAARHLNPGGVIAQWLPLYELTDQNLESVVKTFSNNFRHTMVWMTYYDAILIGSNEPIVLDEQDLERRIRQPEIRKDLESVFMGSAEDLLSYFLMGNKGVSSYAGNGIINSDNNLYLEFSAPLSIGNSNLMVSNIAELFRYREGLLPYLPPEKGTPPDNRRTERWLKNLKAATAADPAYLISLAGGSGTPEFNTRMAGLSSAHPAYARSRYLTSEIERMRSMEPRLVQQLELPLRTSEGKTVTVRFCAVMSRMNKEFAVVDFVDNNSRKRFGRMEVEGEGTDPFIMQKITAIMAGVRDIYGRTAKGATPPSAASVLPDIERLVTSMSKNTPPSN